MNSVLEHINLIGRGFIDFALPMLIQSSILIVILLALDFVLRKKVRAVFRYFLWMLIFIKLVLPVSLSSPISLANLFGDELAGTKSANIIAIKNSVIEPALQSVKPTVPPPSAADAEWVNVEFAAEPSASTAPLLWQGAVFLVWLVVVIAMLLLLLQRAVFVCGLVSQAKPANGLMTDALDFCRNKLGIKSEVGLRVSANATSPAVCGLFRPVILIPQNLGSTLGADGLRTVLLHELVHVKRGDLWVNLIQTLLQIFYFYNPLLWLANAVIRRVREQAVDEAVQVAMGEKAEQYPETLVNVAKLAFKRPALSLRLIGVVESRSALKGRVKRMLNRPIPKSAKLGILGLLTVLIFGAVLLPMAKAKDSVQRIAGRQQKNQKSELVNSQPVVVRTMPAVFTDDVSPGLKSIKVMFDQPMMDLSWSWCGSGDTYPKTTGNPRYNQSKTTCSLPVDLEPGRVYWVGINSPSYKNFQTKARIPAAPYVILFATKGKDGKPTPIPQDLLDKAKAINEKAKQQSGNSEKTEVEGKGENEKSGQLQIIEDEELNLTITIPVGWQCYKNPAPGRYKFSWQLLPSKLKAWAMFIGSEFPQGGIPADTSVRQIAVGDVSALKGFFDVYNVRDDSWKEYVISEIPTVSYVADYKDKDKPMVEYRSYLLSESMVYWFVFRIEKDKFESAKSEFDSIVNSFKLSRTDKDEPVTKDLVPKEPIDSAKKWLKLIDDADYSKSWEKAAEYLKNVVGKEQFQKSVESVRRPLGKVISRKVKSKNYTRQLPGASDGEYVVLEFDTSFENKSAAIETVTPMLDKDGIWRVSGYYIK